MNVDHLDCLFQGQEQFRRGRGAARKRSAPRHFGEPFQKNRGGVYNLRRFLLSLSMIGTTDGFLSDKSIR